MTVASFEVSGLTLSLPVPSGARRPEPAAVDLSVAPGLEQVLAEGWATDVLRLDAVCVAGDAWFWAPGLEGPLLDAASALARKTLGLATLTPGPIHGGPPFEQNYSGDGSTGRHWLAFRSDRLVLCSLGCRGPEAACATLRDGASLTSEAQPAPGALLSGATSLAARPAETASGIAALALLVAAIVLWRRPRPEA